MGRVLYIDAIAGVAGDMLLGALIDAGAPVPSLDGLGLGVSLDVSRVERHGIGAKSVSVVAPAEHVHRTWRDVQRLLSAADAPARAFAVFEALARAEGAVHGVPPEEVHFHEVGAVDALADVLGIALCLDALGISEIVCSPLPMPRGFVRAAHGRLPLPAPAVVELLQGAPVVGVDLDVELVTPTGAAVVSALASGFGGVPEMRLTGVGYGAGTRSLEERPNVVRVLVGETDDGAGPASEVVVVETNLDDLSPQHVPAAVAACFSAGALDVWVTPVQMKKGRPGVVLSALARPAHEAAVVDAVLRHTTALGVRVSRASRVELERSWREVSVDGCRVRVKIGSRDGVVVNVAPEHEDVAAAAVALGRPERDVWAAALAAFGA